MNNTLIIIGVNNDKIYACDDDGEIWTYYSDLELKALFSEIPKLHFLSIEKDDRNNDVICTLGDEKIIFHDLEKLKSFASFKPVEEHLDKESAKFVVNKQKEKLKKRKKSKVTRIAAFALATVLTFPVSVQGYSSIDYVNEIAITAFDEIKDSEFSIGDLDTMVLQGICTVGDNTFVTAYDSSKDKDDSLVYVLDKDKNCINQLTLYNNSHVGGICYDDKNDIFWITDKAGTISGYTYDSIYYNNGEVCTPKFKKVDVGSEDLINYQGNASAGYIAYHDNKIFVGNFSNDGGGILKSFNINGDGSIDLESESKAKFLDKVQGLSFYDKGDSTYLLASTSYGRYNDSKLMILKYDESCKDYTTSQMISCTMPPMMEQITFNKDGKLMTLYESNAKKYKTINNKNGDVIVADIATLVSNFKSI